MEFRIKIMLSGRESKILEIMGFAKREDPSKFFKHYLGKGQLIIYQTLL